MQILVTNDDGIHAPGLRALRDALARLGDVQVVAPFIEQSGVALAITYLHPLMVHEEFRHDAHFGWAVQGSPADCVKLGVLEFCPRKPDLVVSGINAGANVGINVLYSGTVAGAIEGAFFGVTSIAVSLAIDNKPDYPAAAGMAAGIIEQILARRPPAGSLWNVNLPESTPEGPRGVKTASLGVKRHVDVMEKRTDPRGRPYYWSGQTPIENHQAEPGSDVKELADGYATVTPLHFDLTHRRALAGLADVPWRLGPTE
ncbi:MAG: 5'/3'-nucleotidase SurE [Planctomycetales bacterium]